MSVSAAGTFCNVTSEELHYSWHIVPDIGMYRQVDVLCYNHNQSVRISGVMQFGLCVLSSFAYVHSNVHIELNITNKCTFNTVHADKMHKKT